MYLLYVTLILMYLFQNELTYKLSRKLNACRAKLALPYLRMRLDTQVSVVASCVKYGENASPLQIVHSRRRIGNSFASRMSRAFNVEMRYLLAVIGHFSKVICVSVICVRSVVLQPKIRIFTEDDLPLLGRNDEVVPVAVLDSDLYTAPACICSFGKLTEEVKGNGIVLIERHLICIVTSADKGLCAELDSRVKLSKLYVLSVLVYFSPNVYVVIPTSYARDVDTRSSYLSLDIFLICNQLLRICLIVTADFNELKISILNEIKSRRSIVVLYSSDSHF